MADAATPDAIARLRADHRKADGLPTPATPTFEATTLR